MKFKSDIEVQAGLRDGSDDIGTAGQILSSTGSQTNWIDQSSINVSAKLVVIACKNTSGATITKGTPVYQTGTVGATDVIEIAEADASDEDKMAAIGLLQTDINNNDFGNVVITGELLNFTTDPIDGVTPATGDTIYVKSGGGLTLTKPTGLEFIQNVGLVGKVSGGNAGSLTVSSIMRSNDVPTPLYVDHDNQRLGIGTNSPQAKLDVDGDTFLASRHIKISGTGINTYFTAATHDSSGTEGLLNKLSIKSVGTFFDHGALAITNTAVAEPLDTTIVQETISSGDTDWNVLTLPTESGTFALENWVTSNFAPSTGGSYLPLSAGLGSPLTGDLYIEGADKSLRINNGTQPVVFLGDGGANTDGQLILYNSTGGVNVVFNGDNQNHYITNGNVGIGMTDPSANLHVESTNDGMTNGINTNQLKLSYGASVVGAGSSVAFGVSANNNFTGAKIVHERKDGNSAGDLSFWTRELVGTATDYDLTAERMRISSSGNVGIGTDSPSEKLDVVGNIKINSALLSNQNNTDVDSAAAEVVAQVAHATYTAAFFDFVVKKGTNVRSGTVYACHNGDTTPLVEFTETSTNDLGDTSDVTLSVDISGANMRLVATVTSDDWSVKSLIRAI